MLAAARGLAAEAGIPAVSPGTGAALRLLAAAGNARGVVEIGTGTGVSGLWLLRGMRPDGVLTTIDIETEHQRPARRLFTDAGFPPGRTRIIAGRALEVLPRLADGAYDLIFVDADPADYVAYTAEARRLLRAGGVLALHRALAGGRVRDSTAPDPETAKHAASLATLDRSDAPKHAASLAALDRSDALAIREAVRALYDTEDWVTALVPTGAGLLCAVNRG